MQTLITTDTALVRRSTAEEEARAFKPIREVPAMISVRSLKNVAAAAVVSLVAAVAVPQALGQEGNPEPSGDAVDAAVESEQVQWLPTEQADPEATLEVDYAHTRLSTLERDLLRRTGVQVLYPASIGWQARVLLRKKATLEEIAKAVSEQNDMAYEFVEHESGRTFLLFWGPEAPLASWPKMPGILETAKRLAEAEDPNDRMRALMHLGNVHSKGGLRLILRVYVQDEDARVRHEALVQLGRYGKMVPFAGETHWPPARAKLAAEMRAGTRGRREEVARRVIGTADPHLLRVAMKSRNPYIRSNAVKTFASLNAEDVFETLRTSIRTGDNTYLAHVTEGLARNPASEAADMLGELFDGRGLSNQNKARLLKILAGSDDPKSVDLILEHLGDEAANVRQAAAFAAMDLDDERLHKALLGRLRVETRSEVLGPLVRGLRDYPPAHPELARILADGKQLGSLRESAGLALLEAGHRAGLAWYDEAVRKNDRKVIKSAARISTALPLTTALARAGTPEQKIACIRARRIPRPDDVPELTALLAEPGSEAMALAVCQALARCPEPTAMNALGKAAADRKHSYQRQAFAALATRWDAKALNYVRKVLPSADMELMELMTDKRRWGAKLALVPAFQTLAEHENPALRALAVRELGTFHDANAYDTLRASLDDPSPQVRVEGLRALNEYADVRLIPTFARHVTGGPAERDAAYFALGHTHSEKAVAPLAKAYDRERIGGLRESIVHALGHTRSPAAVATLKKAKGDSSARVRMFANNELRLLE